jgi:hypothetical protein
MNSYTALIEPPNYSNTDAKKNMLIIDSYGKLLKDKNSDKIKSPVMDKPLGRVVLNDTGASCKDTKTGDYVPRYSVGDYKKTRGFLASAAADLDAANKCSKVSITAMDEKNNKVEIKNRHIMNEGFTDKYGDEPDLDPGIKFFIGTLSIIGLYMYAQLLYGPH